MSKLFCAWFALKFHETDNFTLYPASILSVNKNRFTKHYFIGAKGGAAIGGIIDSLFAGVGAAPSAAIGGFVGGIIGSFGRSWLAEEGANHLIK